MRPFTSICEMPKALNGSRKSATSDVEPTINIDIEDASRHGDIFVPSSMRPFLQKIVSDAQDLGFAECEIDIGDDTSVKGFYIPSRLVAENNGALRALIGGCFVEQAMNSFSIKNNENSLAVEINREAPENLLALSAIDVSLKRISVEFEQGKNSVKGKCFVVCLGEEDAG